MKLTDGKEFVPAEGVVLISLQFVALDDVVAYLDGSELRQGRVKRLRRGYEEPPSEDFFGRDFVAVEFWQWPEEATQVTSDDFAKPEIVALKRHRDDENLFTLREIRFYSTDKQVRWLGRWQ